MLIKDLPTPALREAARNNIMLVKIAYSQRVTNANTAVGPNDSLRWLECEKTPEGTEFWRHCWYGEWDHARQLQPHLFKPMPWKPHIKIIQWSNEFILGNQNKDIGAMATHKQLAWMKLIMPNWYKTPGEAARAWHSYRRSV